MGGPAIGSVGLAPEGPNNSNDILDIRRTALAFYDLASPFGPITQSPPNFINPGESYATTVGALILEDTGDESITFRSFRPAAVPEPSSLILLGLGTLAASKLTRERKAV